MRAVKEFFLIKGESRYDICLVYETIPLDEAFRIVTYHTILENCSVQESRNAS